MSGALLHEIGLGFTKFHVAKPGSPEVCWVQALVLGVRRLPAEAKLKFVAAMPAQLQAAVEDA